MSSFNHSFSVDLATELGSVDLAILVHHFQYWIRFNKNLNRNKKNGHYWTYQTRKEIVAHFPYWTADQVRRYVDKLVERKILMKGNYNKNPEDNTMWYAFVDEEKYLGLISPGSGESARGSGESANPIPHSLTRPNPHANKGNDCDHEKGLPQSKKKSNTKFPLKKDQKQIFAWLRLQNIDSDDDTLTYYIRTYPEQRIKDAIAFMNEEVDKGIKIGSRGKFLRRVLDGTIVMKNAESEQNKLYAMGYSKMKDWRSLVFTEKYVRDEVTGDDLYFNLPSPVFHFALEKLHDKSTIYQ